MMGTGHDLPGCLGSGSLFVCASFSSSPRGVPGTRKVMVRKHIWRARRLWKSISGELAGYAWPRSAVALRPESNKFCFKFVL